MSHNPAAYGVHQGQIFHLKNIQGLNLSLLELKLSTEVRTSEGCICCNTDTLSVPGDGRSGIHLHECITIAVDVDKASRLLMR